MLIQNLKKDQIGSELEAMIQSPSDYSFVSAYFESIEIWIANLISDFSYVGIHGCTAASFMNLYHTHEDEKNLISLISSKFGISKNQTIVIYIK